MTRVSSVLLGFPKTLPPRPIALTAELANTVLYKANHCAQNVSEGSSKMLLVFRQHSMTANSVPVDIHKTTLDNRNVKLAYPVGAAKLHLFFMSKLH